MLYQVLIINYGQVRSVIIISVIISEPAGCSGRGYLYTSLDHIQKSVLVPIIADFIE